MVKVGPGFKNLYRHSLGLFSFNLNSNPWLVTVNSQLVRLLPEGIVKHLLFEIFVLILCLNG